eukprot:sb/3465948/
MPCRTLLSIYSARKHVTSKTIKILDPKSVKGTKEDEEKMNQWISRKDEERRRSIRTERRKKQEEEKKKNEKEAEKAALSKKNFMQWEDKKRIEFEKKQKRTEEMRARREEKRREKGERQICSEKVFESWKTKKNDRERTETQKRKSEEREIQEEKNRLKAEKAHESKVGYQKWIERQEELEKKKKDAHRAAQEADEELELLKEYRKRDAEDEYNSWKKEKSKTVAVIRKAEHPLGWAPPGKSDGKNRNSESLTSPLGGSGMSRTLAGMRTGAHYQRKLKTVDVCCRKISFWCHCDGSQTSNSQELHCSDPSFSHPGGHSTPNHSHTTPRNGHHHMLANPGYEIPTFQFSRHTTPSNSRPHTPL